MTSGKSELSRCYKFSDVCTVKLQQERQVLANTHNAKNTAHSHSKPSHSPALEPQLNMNK